MVLLAAADSFGLEDAPRPSRHCDLRGLSPDGERIVTGSWDGTAKVWEAASGRELFALEGHTDHINSGAFSPDGQRIVTGSDDRTAVVWEASSGKAMLTFKEHTAPINSVAFS